MSKEAMKLALEALCDIIPANANIEEVRDKQSKASAALREALAEQPAQQEVCGYEHHEYRPYGAPSEVRIHAVLASQYRMPDGTVADEFQWLIDEYKADPNTIKLLPLYTGPQAQPAPEIAIVDAYRAGVDSGIAAEREACARVAEDSDHVVEGRGYYDQLGNADATVKNIAAAIRARSNT